jgi:radical SAM superfamily enzyme YgiQ (UPF0313 family)
MHITLIKPDFSGNRQKFYLYVNRIEPLAIATVAGLIPDAFDIDFFDDRIEPILFDQKTDLVGITVDTYSAKRAYAIALEYRKKGVPVIMGGFHPTLVPNEAEKCADAIVIGEVENVMVELLDDFKNRMLKKRYQSTKPAALENIHPRRALFKGKPYPGISVVEFGRGCKYRCDFCSIHAFYNGRYRSRPIHAVLEEIQRLPNRNVMFADDNLVNGTKEIKELLHGMISLKKRWVGQVSIDVAQDEELLSLIRESGCIGLLLGLESLNNTSLAAMNKPANKQKYVDALQKIRTHGIMVNGSFVLGYDGDTIESLNEELDFSIKQRFIFAGFNHLMPHPGSAVYKRLESEGRLLYKKWWLEQEDYFGSVAFKPKNITPDELALIRYKSRRKFYSIKSIVYRWLDFTMNSRTFFNFLFFVISNIGMRRGHNKEELNSLPSVLLEKHHRD